MRKRLGAVQDDADEIKADSVPVPSGAACVLARGVGDAAAFVPIDGAVRSAVIGDGPGFDFDENEGIGIAGDEIDLDRAAAGTPVTSNDDQALTLEITVGAVFAVAAGGEGGMGAAAAGPVPEFVEQDEKPEEARLI